MTPPTVTLGRICAFRAAIASLTLILLFSGLGGCGGGTAGSGIRSLSGAMADTSGAPLSGVTVTVLDSGASTVTDEQGVFTLPDPNLKPGASEVTFLIEDGSISARAVLDGLPLGEADVVVTIVVDTANNQAVVTSVSVVTPTHTPPAVMTSAPTAVPTNQVPTPTPTSPPTATPSASPTPSPAPTPGCAPVRIEDPCAVDFDRSGNVNVTDFTVMLQLFAAQDPRMDLDGNGVVDTCDFDAARDAIGEFGGQQCPAHRNFS